MVRYFSDPKNAPKGNGSPEVLVPMSAGDAAYLKKMLDEGQAMALGLLHMLNNKKEVSATNKKHMVQLVEQTQTVSRITKAVAEALKDAN